MTFNTAKRFEIIGVVTLMTSCAGLQREGVILALQESAVLNPHRQLVHLSHTCDLTIDGVRVAVIDLRELVRGAMVPRGVNRIVLLDSDLRAVNQIEYTTERPLYCLDNQLFVFGDLRVDGVTGEGNVLTFAEGGETVHLSAIENNELP